MNINDNIMIVLMIMMMILMMIMILIMIMIMIVTMIIDWPCGHQQCPTNHHDHEVFTICWASFSGAVCKSEMS